jgi:hypothetical protein
MFENRAKSVGLIENGREIVDLKVISAEDVAKDLGDLSDL